MAAIIPDGDLTETDAGVVALYAYVCGILIRDAERGWLLKGPEDYAVEMGATPPSLHAFLRKHFPVVVRVYSALGAALRKDGPGLEEKLRAFQANSANGLEDIVSDEALNRAVTEVRLLLPFVKRLPRK